ncbi:MAG: peptidase M23 [Methylococcales bacterium]|nr:MAG: peptidase M23 [Methylococcales bacterium]
MLLSSNYVDCERRLYRRYLVCVFLLCISCTCSYAVDQAEDQITVQADTEAMQRLSVQKDNLLNLLSEIDKHYGETAAVLKQLQAQIEQKRNSLDHIRQEISHCQRDVDKLRKELIEQIRVAYAFGEKDKLKLLLNQQDLAVSGRMMHYFNYFNKERLKKLADLDAAVNHLDILDKQREAEAATLEKDLEGKKSEQLALLEAKKQRNKLLDKMSNDFSSPEQQLSQLQESENSLKLLVSSLPGADKEDVPTGNKPAISKTEKKTEKQGNVEKDVDFFSLKGKLPWPVTGQLSHKFGSARTVVTWDGVLIDANEGEDVRAVTRGSVVFAEWLRGYGLMIILDHGQGYKTLYAFNQSLYKKIGDSVEAGEVIASVGQSGGRSKAGLYFGIRSKGVPVDPIEWCRR